MQTLSRLARKTSRRAALLAIVLFAASAPLAGCADIHPDNTPHSPMGHGR